MSEHFLIDDDGRPLGMFDVDLIQADATALAYALAVAANDRSELERVSSEWLQRVGAAGFGYVAAAAMRQLAEGVVGPLLDVLDSTRSATGIPQQDLCAGLAEARDYAMAVAVTIRMKAQGGEDR